jgi:hypothetical protein
MPLLTEGMIFVFFVYTILAEETVRFEGGLRCASNSHGKYASTTKRVQMAAQRREKLQSARLAHVFLLCFYYIFSGDIGPFVQTVEWHSSLFKETDEQRQARIDLL